MMEFMKLADLVISRGGGSTELSQFDSRITFKFDFKNYIGQLSWWSDILSLNIECIDLDGNYIYMDQHLDVTEADAVVRSREAISQLGISL